MVEIAAVPVCHARTSTEGQTRGDDWTYHVQRNHLPRSIDDTAATGSSPVSTVAIAPLLVRPLLPQGLPLP